MSFERHHPNRDVERNLGRARDLRSACLVACLAVIAEFMSRACRARGEVPVSTGLEQLVPPIGKQPILPK
jgi:hypothetical protein